MKRIKVIEYISNLGDGGAETVVKEYARLLDRTRFEMLIVITRKFGPSANRKIVDELQIPVVEIYPRWNIGVKIWNKLFGNWYVPYKLRKIIQAEKPQVLHVHLALLHYVKRIGCVLNGVRLFYTCHSLPAVFLGKQRPKEARAARYLITKHGLKLIALHEDMAQELNGMFGISDTTVLHNGVDYSVFRDSKISKTDKRRELGIPDDSFVMGHVGRFRVEKNHDFLVEVFLEVTKRKANAFLVLVGSGDSSHIMAKLQRYGLDDRYVLLSERSDVHEIMRAMDVFVFPSLYEGWGLALSEAQVCGLKCVAANTLPQLVTELTNTVVLPLGNAAEWAETIVADTCLREISGSELHNDIRKTIPKVESLYAGRYTE